jgi:ribosomal protein S18 acetylase RimI-like enzyme
MRCDIRPMLERDVPAIATLGEEGFAHFYRIDWGENARALYKAVLALRATVAVAESCGEAIAYCNLRSWPAGGWIDQIVVSHNKRRSGVGRALLEAAMVAARERGFWKVSLITSEADPEALSFFQACGWETVGRMKDEIKQGVDGIMLGRIVDYQLHPNRGCAQ